MSEAHRPSRHPGAVDAPAGELELVRLRPSAVGADGLAAWRDLVARVAEPNPFFEPEFLLPAVEHLPGGEHAELLVARDGGGTWRALLPARAQPKWGRVVLPCARSWTNLYAFLATPLVDPAWRVEAAAALAGATRLWRLRAFLVVEHAAGGPALDALLAPRPGAPDPIAWERTDRAGLRRRPEDTYLQEGASGKRRRELGRTRRNLARDLGAEVALVDATDEPGAVDRFLALEAAGWKGEAGTALTSDPSHERFLREVADAFGALGRLHVLELRAGARTLASLFAIVASGTLYTLKIGYDETLASGAPGVLLLADLATWFHGRPELQVADSCAAPEHPTINRLWPDRLPLVTAVVPAAGVRGRAVEPVVRAAGAPTAEVAA